MEEKNDSFGFRFRVGECLPVEQAGQGNTTEPSSELLEQLAAVEKIVWKNVVSLVHRLVKDS